MKQLKDPNKAKFPQLWSLNEDVIAEETEEKSAKKVAKKPPRPKLELDERKHVLDRFKKTQYFKAMLSETASQ